MNPRLTRVPSVAVEALRILIVIFGAGLGLEIGQALGGEVDDPVLGPFNGIWLGGIVGAGLGYSLGGVLARAVLQAIDEGERALSRLSAEQVVAGGVGAVGGAALVAIVAWPLFLVGDAKLMLPLFVLLVLVGAIFGFRVGRNRREAVLGTVGPRAGMVTPQRSPATLPRILDTSVAVDGRIIDVVRAGFAQGLLLVPRPVLGELQAMADSADPLRRSKGRRGLDVLETLRHEPGVELRIIPDEAPGVAEVDGKLVRICLDRDAALLTFDTNLAKVAALAGAHVLNLHRLAVSLRPPVVVGDEVVVVVSRPGREAGQGVAYLDDGTMVVVEGGRSLVGGEANVTVTSVLTTANGRMVFARPAAAPYAGHEAGPAAGPATPGPRPTTHEPGPAGPTTHEPGP